MRRSPRRPARCIALLVLPWVLVSSLSEAQTWVPSSPACRISREADGSWRVVSSEDDEFTLDSSQSLPAAPGDCFEMNVKLRLGLGTKALPELACFDASGRQIDGPSSLESGANHVTTNLQHFRRVFAARAGTAIVRARIRARGDGELHIRELEFKPAHVDPYQTGMLIAQMHPAVRRGLVLESNLGILNAEQLSSEDRDGDGKWAVIRVDLDDLSIPPEEGVDWRSSFADDPNRISWSDGVVLKSDSVLQDREPDLRRALHFRMQAHPGSYRVLLSNPGRAVAVSLDGRAWRRFDGDDECELGTIQLAAGTIELWIDACYRDAITAGPVYFDYVRLIPGDDAAAAERLFDAARRKEPASIRGSVEERRVEITVDARRSADAVNWPVRCGLPIPRGELSSPEHVRLLDAEGTVVASAQRSMATWPDGSVKWLQVDFLHDFSKASQARYTVCYGNSVRPMPASGGVQMKPTDDGLEVDTGSVRFTVPKSTFGIIQDVRLASGRIVQKAPIAVEVVENDGKIWRALDSAVDQLDIEQPGSIHAVIRTSTMLTAPGKRSRGFYHSARIHAFAGSPLVEVDYFLANTDDRSRVKARTIRMEIQPVGRIEGSGAVVQGSTSHAQGWLTLGSEAMLSLGVEAFCEQYPKALRWKPDRLQLDLWAAEGGDYDWVQGVGKTHRIFLYYGQPLDAGLLGHGPVLALADPSWYASSGAFGPLTTASARVVPAIEDQLADHIADPVVARVGLGYENYGDHYSRGYVRGSHLWDNNEYDMPAACFVHFARTGDREALRIALASAQHYLDVDIAHYSRRHPDWVGAAYTHSHGTNPHHTAEAPGMQHAGYVQGLIWYSYLTGDPSGIEGARGIADWVLRNMKPESNVGYLDRVMGHPLMTLTDVYEATWDEKYLRGAARLVDWALKWEHPARSGFLAPITEAPALYSASPFCGGILTSALLKFNGWARSPDVDALLERLARSLLTDMWRPPAGIMFKGGFSSESAAPWCISTHLRLMRAMYERTADPLFLAVPLESVLAAFKPDARPFGTRTTGLVFNYLPWFLATLEQQGVSRLDADLVITPGDESVAMQQGTSHRLRFAVRNAGTSPVSDLSFSFQPRLDFRVLRQADPPDALAPGEKAEFSCEVQAPERINLTSKANAVAYAHACASFRRDGRLGVAHSWVRITIEPADGSHAQH